MSFFRATLGTSQNHRWADFFGASILKNVTEFFSIFQCLECSEGMHKAPTTANNDPATNPMTTSRPGWPLLSSESGSIDFIAQSRLDFLIRGLIIVEIRIHCHLYYLSSTITATMDYYIRRHGLVIELDGIADLGVGCLPNRPITDSSQKRQSTTVITSSPSNFRWHSPVIVGFSTRIVVQTNYVSFLEPPNSRPASRKRLIGRLFIVQFPMWPIGKDRLSELPRRVRFISFFRIKNGFFILLAAILGSNHQ